MKNSSIVLSLIFYFVISGCKNCKGQVDGGPCSYTTKYYPAQVIDIFEIDSLYSEIYFLLKDSTVIDTDTMTYSSEFTGYINTDTLRKKDIKIGDLFKYEIKDIQSGHCSPHLERLLLEKYE